MPASGHLEPEERQNQRKRNLKLHQRMVVIKWVMELIGTIVFLRVVERYTVLVPAVLRTQQVAVLNVLEMQTRHMMDLQALQKTIMKLTVVL